MADTPDPERELDPDAASRAISDAFAKLHGGRRGGKQDERRNPAKRDRRVMLPREDRGRRATDGVNRG